jgi:hypothetical protein
LGPEGVSFLCEALEINQTLQEIYLAQNKLGPIGIQTLAKTIEKNRVLQELDLSYNEADFDSAMSLAEALAAAYNIQILKLEDQHPCKDLIQKRIAENTAIHHYNSFETLQHLNKVFPSALSDITMEYIFPNEYAIRTYQLNIVENGKTFLLNALEVQKNYEQLRKSDIKNRRLVLEALEQCKVNKDHGKLPDPELALRRASAAGKINIIRTLLDNVHDLDILAKSPESNKTAIDFARKYKQPRVEELLLTAIQEKLLKKNPKREEQPNRMQLDPT